MSVFTQQWVASGAYQWRDHKPVRSAYRPGFVGFVKDLFFMIFGEI